MHELDFTIPDQSVDANQLIPKATVNDINRWLNDLPLVNPGHSAHLLCDYLKEVNQCAINYTDRFKILEELRTTCSDLTASLRGKYTQATLPLSIRNTQYFNDALQMHRLICIGYKSVIADITETNTATDKKNLIVFSLYHAIQQLSLIMLESYIVYRPVAANTWHEIHNLFVTAEEREVLNTLIPISLDGEQTETIDISYKRALLLALANPYHLMQEEAQAVFNLLSKLSQGLILKPCPQNEVIESGFAIDLHSDSTPLYLSTARKANLLKPRLMEMRRLIDALKSHTTKLDDAIAQQIKLKQSSLAVRLRRDLMLRLHNSWSRSRERSEERQTTLGYKDAILSLSTAHYHISNKQPFTPEIDEIKTYATKALETSGLFLVPKDYEPWKTEEAEQRLEAGIDQPRSSNFDAESNVLDKWEKIYAVKTSRDNDDVNLDPEYSDKHNISSWEIKNLSQTGLSLFCQSDHCLPVRVGELMSYRDEKRWRLGVIRWLHASDQSTIELGIMLISDHCKPIASRAVRGIGKGGEYMRSLLLDADELDNNNSQLLVPAAIYHNGTELVINNSGTISYIRLTEQLLSTKSINIFRFEVIERPDTESRNIEALKELLN